MNQPHDRAGVYASLSRMAEEMAVRWAQAAQETDTEGQGELAEDRLQTAALYAQAALELPGMERNTRERPAHERSGERPRPGGATETRTRTANALLPDGRLLVVVRLPETAPRWLADGDSCLLQLRDTALGHLIILLDAHPGSDDELLRDARNIAGQIKRGMVTPGEPTEIATRQPTEKGHATDTP